MSRIFAIKIGLWLLAIMLAACGQPHTGSIPMYRVNESTGLYSAFGDINAEQLAVLPMGTVLVPADGATELFCDSFRESGMAYGLCKVEVVETGQTGWVLRLYIEKI